MNVLSLSWNRKRCNLSYHKKNTLSVCEKTLMFTITWFQKTLNTLKIRNSSTKTHHKHFIKSSLVEDLEFPSYTESILVLPDSIRKNLTSITNLGFKTLPSSGGQVCEASRRELIGSPAPAVGRWEMTPRNSSTNSWSRAGSFQGRGKKTTETKKWLSTDDATGKYSKKKRTSESWPGFPFSHKCQSVFAII